MSRGRSSPRRPGSETSRINRWVGSLPEASGDTAGAVLLDGSFLSPKAAWERGDVIAA